MARFLGKNNLIRVMRLSAMKTERGEFKTLDGGQTLTVPIRSGELPPINKPCLLAIRPEHVVLSHAQVTGENVLSATVRGIQFSGGTSTVVLDANGLRLEALVLSLGEFSAGERCAVVLPAEKIRVLKE